MRRILISLFTIGIISTLAFGLSRAFFSDTETSTENVLSAGAVDLLVNGENDPDFVVNFEDLKPGDVYEQEKTLFINSNPSNVWLHIKDVVASQGTQTEPEDEEEAGTPKFDIQNYLGYSLSVSTEDVIASASAIPFMDAVSCWIPLGEIPGNQIVSVFQRFHFDPTVTNWAQGDSLTFTEEFFAQQTRNDPPPPVSETGRVWNEETGQCEDASSLLWIIGDEEVSQTDNPVDELNFVALGNYPNPATYTPSYTRNITSPVDDPTDELFPWNSDFSNSYARTIHINFNHTGSTINTLLTLKWSPGVSGVENKQIYLDNVLVGSVGPFPGSSNPAWWNNYAMRIDTFNLSITNGSHEIRLEQTTGDGTVWDYIKLERL